MDEPGPTTTAVDDALYRETAKKCWTDDDLEIDEGAIVSVGDAGAWVQAWVWVSDYDAGIDVPETKFEKACRLRKANASVGIARSTNSPGL